MLGFYNYTVILTYFGMLASFTGITFALEGNIQTALICLMISGICDMFDGKVAATKTRTVAEKRFGIQIDSLSDLICFGVFPAVIVVQTAPQNVVAFYIAGIYLLCALIRLAYFNVDEEDRQSQTQKARTVYLGLPVTTAALIIPAAFGISRLLRWPMGMTGPILLLLMGGAFLTPFQLKKPALPGKISMILLGTANLVLLFAGADV